MRNSVYLSYARQNEESCEKLLRKLHEYCKCNIDMTRDVCSEVSERRDSNYVYILYYSSLLCKEKSEIERITKEILLMKERNILIYFFLSDEVGVNKNDFLNNVDASRAVELESILDQVNNYSSAKRLSASIRLSTEGTKSHVFISYRSTDYSFAYDVVKELERFNITCWFDKKELNKEVTEEYTEKIHKGIENSEIVLYIYNHDVTDFIAHNEIGYASKIGKRIFCFPKDDMFDLSKCEPSENRDYVISLLEKKQHLCNSFNASYVPALKEAQEAHAHKQKLAGKILDLRNSAHKDTDILMVRLALQEYFRLPMPYGTYTKLEGSTEGNPYTTEEIQMKAINKAFFYPVPPKQYKELKDLNFFETKQSKAKTKAALQELRTKYNLDDSSLLEELKDYIRKNYSEDIKDVDAFLNEVAVKTAENLIQQKREKKDMFNGNMVGIYSAENVIEPNTETATLCVDLYHSDYYTFQFTVELYHSLRSIRNTFFINHLSDLRKYAPFLCSLGIGGFIATRQNDLDYLLWVKRSNNISSGNMWHFSFDETVSVEKDSEREDKEGQIQEEDKDIKINSDGSIKILAYKGFYRGIKEELGLFPARFCKKRGIIEIGIIQSDRLEIELLSYAAMHMLPNESLKKQFTEALLSSDHAKLEIEEIDFIRFEENEKSLVGKLITPESMSLSSRIKMRRESYLEYEDVTSESYKNKPLLGEDISIGVKVKIGKNVRIGNNVRIADNVSIGDNVILTKDISIGQNVVIENNVLIEDNCRLSKGCYISSKCKLHRNVFVDEGVKIAAKVKIQNNNSIYHGVHLSEGAFIGTNVSFTNDKYPRSINRDGTVKTSKDWKVTETLVQKGASICSGSTIVCGVTIGEWAMVGAGAIVTKDVAPETTVVSPAAVVIDNKHKK